VKQPFDSDSFRVQKENEKKWTSTYTSNTVFKCWSCSQDSYSNKICVIFWLWLIIMKNLQCASFILKMHTFSFKFECHLSIYNYSIKVTDYFRTTTTLEICTHEINHWKYPARAKTCQKENKQSSNKMKNFIFQPAKTLAFCLGLYIFLYFIWKILQKSFF